MALVGALTAATIIAGTVLWRAGGLSSGGGNVSRPNILLITIDTLRWDGLGCYGNPRAGTPVLDALARRGTRFETAIAHVPLTGPSHASILTGLTPLRHGVRDNGGYVLPPQVPTLAVLFKKAGYATGAFVSGFPLDHRFGFASGFESYDDRLPRGDAPWRGSYTERRADATTDQAIAWIDTQRVLTGASANSTPGRPWFAWVHYFDPHAPYEPPGEFGSRFAGRPYDGEVAFVDAQIGRLLHRLDERHDTERTLVLVTADHGESMGEHGEETHGVFVYDATLRVPFIVAGPGVHEGQTAGVVARGVDVAPTLLDLAGLAVQGGIDGRTLRAAVEGEPMRDEPAYVESLMAQRHLAWAPLHGLRSANWKFIDAPRRELYDLTHDAAEQHNRIQDQPRPAAALARQLSAQMRNATTPAAAVATDRETTEQLRALGYLGGAPDRPVNPSGNDPKDGIGLITRLEHGVAEAKANPERAIAMLRSVLEEDPEVTLARRHLALAFVGLQQYGAAISELEWLRRNRKATADDLLVLSESLRVTGKPAQAHALLAEASRLDPRSPEPALTEARAFRAEQKLQEAERAYRRALAVASDHPEALLGLGDVALARGDSATAAGYFERARSRDPGDPEAALRLALLRAREGRVEIALPLFQQAARQLPSNGEALAGLAAALARTGRPAEAIPYFERAVDAGQRSPAMFNGLGFARLEVGDRRGALVALRSSLELRRDQPQVAEVVKQLSDARVAGR